MRVAITGASGFLGTHIVAELETYGHDVMRIPRGASGDLVSPEAGERADALVHLAFPTDAAERRARPTATLSRVVRHAADAIAFAGALGAKHVVLASTGKVYGLPATLPIEDGTAAHPTTQLGELKLLAENIFAAAARTTGLGATSLRIFNAYGPGQPDYFLVPTVLSGIARGTLSLGELDHARDWIHCTDVAGAVRCALESPADAAQARTWNVASGEAHDVRGILERLCRAGASVPEPTIDGAKLRGREASEERASCEGLRAHGWSPRVPLDQGLADLFAGRAPRASGAAPLRQLEPLRPAGSTR
jgi:GDP-4-dehydro-6-deoxy-D-mannose reductase